MSVDEVEVETRWWMFRRRLVHWYLQKVAALFESIEWRGDHYR